VDVVTAILACSLYPTDDALVHAIAANAHMNPYFVYDPTPDTADGELPADPHSAAQALARADEVTAKGAKPLLGLLEIPPAWLAGFGRDRREAFDACVNVAIGTAWLAAFGTDCARGGHGLPRVRGPRDTRACVLRRYADAIEMPDLVPVVTRELELRAKSPKPLAVIDSGLFPTAPSGPWGPNRIFAPVTSLLLPPEEPSKRGEARR